METELIIKSIMGLIVILALLIFLLFIEPNKDAPAKKTPASTKEKIKEVEIKTEEEPVKEAIQDSGAKIKTDINSLLDILKNKRSDATKLGEALDLIIKHHGIVHKKLGLRSHPEFDVYMDILFTICRHPNANKDLIINFDKELERLNPDYKKDINEAITKGLNSRRV